jgi:hypothetical protein
MSENKGKTEEWQEKLLGKKLGEHTDEVVSLCSIALFSHSLTKLLDFREDGSTGSASRGQGE